jgi:hypothetical protein
MHACTHARTISRAQRFRGMAAKIEAIFARDAPPEPLPLDERCAVAYPAKSARSPCRPPCRDRCRSLAELEGPVAENGCRFTHVDLSGNELSPAGVAAIATCELRRRVRNRRPNSTNAFSSAALQGARQLAVLNLSSAGAARGNTMVRGGDPVLVGADRARAHRASPAASPLRSC